MGDRVNSFSAFGEKRNSYMTLFPVIIRMHYSLYPDPAWKIHLTTDREFSNDEYYGRQVNALREAGLLQLRIVNNGGLMWQQSVKGIGMLWRMIPIWNSNNDYVFCRDLDSILTPRQTQLVQSFIGSGQIVHGINDNDGHSIPLMGGMTGFRSQAFLGISGYSSFESMIESLGKPRSFWDRHGADQEFLMNYIWPKFYHSSLIHRMSGPNDRSHIKQVVPNLLLDGVSQKILSEGDNFTNYIGASNCINTTHGERTLAEMIAFYDEHGSVDVMRKIREVEKQ